MIVYADVLFLVNFISAYIQLYLLGKFIIKTKIKKWRISLASAAGAAGAMAVFILSLPTALSYALRALSAVLMVFIAFYEQKRQILPHIMWLFALSGILIAAMMSLALLAGVTVNTVIKSGVVYFDLPQRIFLPMLVISFAAVTVFMKILRRKRAKRLYDITVIYGSKKITVTALFDSGNLLKEPITGKAVNLIEWKKARSLFCGDYTAETIIFNDEGIKLYAVPYRTVGIKSGIIYAFSPDRIEILGENRTIDNALVGLYDGRLSKGNEYNALLSADMI